MAWTEPLTASAVFTSATRECVATCKDGTNTVIGTANVRIHLADHLAVMGDHAPSQAAQGTAAQRVRVAVLLIRALAQECQNRGVTRLHADVSPSAVALCQRVLGNPDARHPTGNVSYDRAFGPVYTFIFNHSDASGNIL